MKIFLIKLVELLYDHLYNMISDDDKIDGEILPVLDTARDDFQSVIEMLFKP